MGDNERDNIEFTISGDDHKSVKRWVNIVATAVAIGIATASAMKPADPMGEKSYAELKKAIETCGSDAKQNHDDIIALRNFLEGYTRAAVPIPAPPPGASSVYVPVKIHTPARPGGSALGVAVLPAPSPPDLPKLGPPPQSQKLPEYGDLKQ